MMTKVGCADLNGFVYDGDGAYVGKISDKYYAFDMEGNLLGLFDENGALRLEKYPGAKLFLHHLNMLV